jgi:hypothetical protein
MKKFQITNSKLQANYNDKTEKKTNYKQFAHFILQAHQSVLCSFVVTVWFGNLNYGW